MVKLTTKRRRHTAPGRAGRVLLLLLLLVASLGMLAALGCTPSPKSMPCSNNGDCRALGEGYEYCLEARCVRCISRSMCDPGELCVDGECVKR